jgi:hypothetical protein
MHEAGRFPRLSATLARTLPPRVAMARGEGNDVHHNRFADSLGRLWIATDGNDAITTGRSDGLRDSFSRLS